MVVRNLPTDDDGLMLKVETGTGAINRPGGKTVLKVKILQPTKILKFEKVLYVES